MSNNDNIQQVITGGIQGISAILPLLGTEQCEEHVGSALSRGFCYVGITPISIFGSLGIVKAALNVLLASITIRRGGFLGAQRLADGGFHPKGDVAPMIAIDKQTPERFLAESQLEKMLDDENIENIEDLTVEWNEDTMKWNFYMIAFSLAMSVMGFAPYVYFVKTGLTGPLLFHGWPFPVMRLLGSTILGVLVQIIIQIRIMKITKSRIIFILVDRQIRSEFTEIQELMSEDIWSKRKSSEICLWNLEKKLSECIKQRTDNYELNSLPSVGKLEDYLNKQYNMHFPFNSMQGVFYGLGVTPKILLIGLQAILFISLFISVLGYVGSFYVVQNVPAGSAGPIVWLGTELILCLIRVFVWAANPKWDDAKGMEFKLKLIKRLPLPTCDLYGDEFERLGSAPFVRAKEFLNETATIAGPTPSFIWDDISLYFMFTRISAPDQQLRNRILYIVFIHDKEQTSRLLVKRNASKTFLIYHCSVKFNPEQTAVEVQTNFEHGRTSKETHLFTANDEFIKRISEYYDQILRRYTDMKDVIFFGKSWTLNDDAVRVSKGTTSNHEIEHAVSSQIIMESDTVYLKIGILKRQCFHLIDQFSNWVELYLDLFMMQELDVDDEYTVVTLPGFRTFYFVRILYLCIIRFETDFLMNLNRVFNTWNAVITTHHKDMSSVLSKESGSEGTLSIDKLKKRMMNRLSDEKKLYRIHFKQKVLGRIKKLKTQFKDARNKIEEMGTHINKSTYETTEISLHYKTPSITKHLLMKRDKIIDRYTYQLKEIYGANDKSILSPDSPLAKNWEMCALKERIRFLDKKHKFLTISDETYNAFGNFDGLISALKAGGTITLVTFDTTSTPSVFTTQNIIKIITEVKSITSVAYSPDIDFEAIKDALNKNREQNSYPQPRLYYENVSIGSNSTLSDQPYLIFHSVGAMDAGDVTNSIPPFYGKNGSETSASTCVMKFEIEEKINHVLTLKHCFADGTGLLDLNLNNDRFVVKITSNPFIGFNEQRIILSHTMLNGPGQVNTLKINVAIAGVAPEPDDQYIVGQLADWYAVLELGGLTEDRFSALYDSYNSQTRHRRENSNGTYYLSNMRIRREKAESVMTSDSTSRSV